MVLTFHIITTLLHDYRETRTFDIMKLNSHYWWLYPWQYTMEPPKAIETENDLMEIIKNIPFVNDGQRNEVVCSFIGHSNIIDTCRWYVYCWRCKAQIGDSLGWYYDNPWAVIIWHKCDICTANYDKCTWKDKLYVDDPFK